MASTSQYQDTGVSYPNPNVQGNPYIYLAVYSSVPVYEMMVRGIGVMRRRADSWLNATQILKVAGVDKGKRTKILEKDIAQGVHEKVQGGYGRYQGTWIPFERSVELANAFGVSHLLAPLFDYTAPPPPVSLGGAAPPPAIVNPYGAGPPPLPPPPAAMQAQPQQHLAPPPSQAHAQDANAILHHARQQGLLPHAGPSGMHAQQQQHMAPPPVQALKRSGDSLDQDDIKRARLEVTNGFGNGYGAPTPAPMLTPAPLPLGPPSNFRTTLKMSSKPPYDPATLDPGLLERNRTALKSIFAMEPEQPTPGGGPAPTPDLATLFPPDLDADTPIDENLHTALHWAAALARVSLVRALVQFGADLDRGNNVGETPLIRAVLVTNNSDHDSFLRLLEVLAPSLRTVDDVGRSVLHHAALVAGVKGRAASARYYMETVLEYIATREGGRFAALVDAQDAHGDTALNIAARGGNRALVRLLLDVGADKMKANKLGLRPTDFGVEDPELTVNAAEETLHALQNQDGDSPNVPVQASGDVLRSITDTLSSLSSSFQAELQTKSDELDAKREQLRQLAAELAAQRSALSLARTRVSKADEQAQRVRNLALAIESEDQFDWTGRTEVDGSPASQLAGPGFTYRGPQSTLSNLPSGISIEFDADPALPEILRAEDGAVSGEALVHLLRLQAWYERVEGLMKQRLERLESGNGAMEEKLRRIVASCCGVEEDKVDDMLEGLVRSLEADPSATDLPRVAGFLSRIKDGTLA
ncbi:uncharacterized protein JCM10292_006403 [Rhodotorula paludigena]|uniref:uncharacterized protein n=1 Tax=Rhodotorula paludigena TaxID=86838 RepID=UPI00317F9B44